MKGAFLFVRSEKLHIIFIYTSSFRNLIDFLVRMVLVNIVDPVVDLFEEVRLFAQDAFP